MKYNKIRDDIAMGRLSRRDLGKLMAAAGVAMVAMPVGGRSARAAAADMTYFTWSGYDLPEFFPGYVEKHGAAPSTALFADEEEALQKLRAGFQADVVHPCSGRVRRWREAGAIQSFDTSRLTHWPQVIESLKDVNGAHADGQQWFAPVDWGNTSILYRTDLVEWEGEESWEILWDERYAGRLSMGEDITDTGIITGLLVGAENPYQMTDEELEKVRAKLQEQKPLLRFYWNDTTVLEQAMASGEVVAAPAWNSSVVALSNAGVPVAYANPKEGILAWCCGLVVSSTATELDLAHDFIDAMISPEAGVWLITEYGYGHSNKEALAQVDPALLEELGLPQDPTEMFQRAVFSADNTRIDELQAIFEEVKAGL